MNSAVAALPVSVVTSEKIKLETQNNKTLQTLGLGLGLGKEDGFLQDEELITEQIRALSGIVREGCSLP